MVDPKSCALIDEMLDHLRADFVDTEPASRIAKLYANRSLFITGATGFIGKALVEKLVRSCTDIKKIYLLVREKRGKDAKSRLADLVQSQIFNRIKSLPHGAKLLEQKLHAIQGDITMERFGISQEDMQLLSQDVSIVFNSAATIRFVEPIDVAVRNNIYSVSQLVQFCNQLQNLQALVHLSTAYSNCHKRDTIYEIFYEPPMSGDQIIQAMNTLRDLQNSIHVYPSLAPESSSSSSSSSSISGESETAANGLPEQSKGESSCMESEASRSACLPQIFYKRSAPADADSEKQQRQGKQNEAPDLLDQFTEIALRRSNRPNTYTFTKAIAESYLLDLVGRLPERYLGPQGIPVAIVRPSIVGGAWREPDVGFVDNYNGGTGAILSLYTGALQAMPGCGSRVADMVPVDMVVNMIIATGYYLASEHGRVEQWEQTPASGDNSSSSGEMSVVGRQSGDKRKKRREEEEARSKNIKTDRGVYVFNFVSGYRNPLRWNQVTQMIQELAYKYPSKFQVRLCGSYFVSAQSSLGWWPLAALLCSPYDFYDYVNHYLAAKVQDLCRRYLLGQPMTPSTARQSAVVAYGRIKQMTDTLTPFTSNQWLLCDSNVRALNGRLSEADRQLFQFDIGQIDWPHYIRNYILGARIYTLKDEPRNVPHALKSLERRQLAYRSTMMILCLLSYWLFISSSQLETILVGLVEPFLYL